jgi:multicomponent Na+:H+ antiporter subunit D
VLENDIRRLLSYHIISQVGFMVCGVGIGTAMALNGTSSHAFSHVFYKGLLMMSVGAVIHATGRSRLSDLGGLARPLKWTLVMMTIGAFSISGVPLFNGFISKSMVVAAAAQSHRAQIELILMVAAMGTFLSIGLKLIWFTFFGPASTTPSAVLRPVPPSMMLAMGLASAVCIVTGLAPDLLYRALPHPVDYHPFTLDHVLIALEHLLGTALGFWILRGVLGGKRTITLDVDRLYRRPLALALTGSSQGLGASFAAVERGLRALGSGARQGWRSSLTRYVPSALTHRIAVVMLFCAAMWYLAQWH